MREGDNVKNRIKDLRQRDGMSQAELAEKVGVTRQTIIYLEKGTYNPSLKLALKIASVFKVTIEQLFELDAHEEPSE
ncbi:MAG: helix-turn-helix transcriptional regulator [Candidatus Hodarchaeota archaeon]